MSEKKIKTAVITGGHPFDVIGFGDLWRDLPDVQAYIQHIDDFAAAREEIRDSYDVILFYSFMQPEPQDENQPWYAGKPKTALEHLGVSGQGLVILHHALLAYRGWGVWNDLVGATERGFGYHQDVQLRVQVADRQHPITKGLEDWDMVDETYTMADAGESNQILLTTDNPRSMRTLAWIHRYKNARVFCLESGHDNRTYGNPGFQKVLIRGLQWAAKRI